MAADRQSPMIDGLNKKFAEAMKTRDFAAVAEMFTDDAVMLPPRRNMIVGKNAIRSFWEQAARIQKIEFATDSVATLGADAVREIGTLSLSVGQPDALRDDEEEDTESAVEVADSQSREVLGKYVFVWRKVKDDWKLETSIWNRNRPEATSRRARRRRARE
jgi:uncharacterized protein (TIGR02246 family)